MIMPTRRFIQAAIFTVLAVSLIAQADRASNADFAEGDFFIVSSIDLAKKQILLKRPTEVTELMRVDSSTRYFEERGKPMRLADLRAGDTVYIVSKPNAEQPVAITIQKGPMTVEVLRERFL